MLIGCIIYMSDYLKKQLEDCIMEMEKMITQIKYTGKSGDSEKESSALCTMNYDDYFKDTSSWKCKFTNMSLTEIAKFIVAFFDSTSVTVKNLTFTIFEKRISVKKSSSDHNYKHYLEELCSQIVIE